MSWLELEIKLASSAGATPAPFAPPPPLATSGGYVQAAKGNNNNNMEGSCGASFSGSASTVMASEAVDDDAWVDQLLTDGPTVQE
ncbi:hypothetical protein E2562_026882 [Oryza meyeriana var. granulata]|uniref:Uncharacterized protein n=1 Tax=Oryza meyeriana var. granulata TaxID=110450 RepID=A0A6G1EPM4_9ORYZ|nr:hypothetical protein E2562_026882 [Oryza meyeriana var. granulata]